jgi:CelD/BcsL family acetyltransferase involved in cellulose biosynthesis
MIGARTWDEVESLAGVWDATRWQNERAELAYFIAEGGTPLAYFDDGAGLVGRVEETTLPARLGYLRVPAPRVRLLRAVGVAGDVAPLARAALRDVDVVGVPALPVASPEYESLAPLDGERFVRPWQRYRLVLPESFDAFLASRSRKSRAGIRYDAKRLETAFGAGRRVEIFRAPTPALFDDIDSIARTTYQRRLGHGFSLDRSPQLSVALEHGWTRIYVLYDGDRPVAYWQCGVYRETIRLDSTGYLPDYAHLRPGIYLLMRVIEDAIGDPALQVLDFGPGRSDYKRHFSSESYLERNLVLYATTLRARRARAVRNAVAGTTLAARRALDATGSSQRVKTAWRRRLRA